jgi:hypothetical protein
MCIVDIIDEIYEQQCVMVVGKTASISMKVLGSIWRVRYNWISIAHFSLENPVAYSVDFLNTFVFFEPYPIFNLI